MTLLLVLGIRSEVSFTARDVSASVQGRSAVARFCPAELKGHFLSFSIKSAINLSAVKEELDNILRYKLKKKKKMVLSKRPDPTESMI